MADTIRTIPTLESTTRDRRRARHVRHAGRVLLVGDSSDDYEMYADYLRIEGFCALETHTAADAYRFVTEVPPSVVIADVRLRGNEDGLELIRHLKQDMRLRDLPVVIVTGYVSGSVREAAKRAGCDVFVVKPCLPDELSRIVNSLISTTRGAPASTPDGPMKLV